MKKIVCLIFVGALFLNYLGLNTYANNDVQIMTLSEEEFEENKFSEGEKDTSRIDTYVLSNGKTLNMYTEKPFYLARSREKVKVFKTHYDENKMIIGYFNEATQVMNQEWYDNNQLVNTVTFDFSAEYRAEPEEPVMVLTNAGWGFIHQIAGPNSYCCPKAVADANRWKRVNIEINTDDVSSVQDDFIYDTNRLAKAESTIERLAGETVLGVILNTISKVIISASLGDVSSALASIENAINAGLYADDVVETSKLATEASSYLYSYFVELKEYDHLRA